MGKGTAKNVSATNAATASPSMAGWPRPFLATRVTAWSTTAMIAGASPRKSAWTMVASP